MGVGAESEDSSQRVLVVDDSAINRHITTEALTRSGYQVTVARDGAEAETQTVRGMLATNRPSGERLYGVQDVSRRLINQSGAPLDTFVYVGFEHRPSAKAGAAQPI
jgi:hypothetical protein